MRAFWSDRRGNVAVIFGLSLLPILGFVGAAVDYGRAVAFKHDMQRVGDQSALTVGSYADKAGVTSKALENARRTLQAKYGDSGVLESLNVAGAWTSPTHYTVTIDGVLKAQILPAVPGMPKTFNAKTETVVLAQTEVTPKPPKSSTLSYEAADFNLVSVYCYNFGWNDKDSPYYKPNDPNKGRDLTTLTKIASNGTTPDYTKLDGFKMPICKAGEIHSYQNRNVREARTNSSKWFDDSVTHYLYFTDTSYNRNTENVTDTVTSVKVESKVPTPHDITGKPMLETIVCANTNECRQQRDGGILPNNEQRNRNPAVATGRCPKGQYRYYGFEDRPGGDRDFDDVRIVVSCPEFDKATQVRLIK